MGLFSKKGKATANPLAEQYRGKLRPPVGSSANGFKITSAVPNKPVLPASTAQALPVIRKKNHESEEYIIVVSLTKIRVNAQKWWDQFFQSWMDADRAFMYIDSTNEDYPQIKEDSMLLYAFDEAEANSLEEEINSSAMMRRAAYVYQAIDEFD